jgi:hypothetical protein
MVESYDRGIHHNPDAMAWVKLFREINPECNVPDDVMLGWFANAMMAMYDHVLATPSAALNKSKARSTEVYAQVQQIGSPIRGLRDKPPSEPPGER